MASILLFIQAVFSHWIATLGIILTLTPLIPEHFQRWIEGKMKRPLSLKHLWVVGALLLLIAFYQAWNDEHTARAESDRTIQSLTVPDFKFSYGNSAAAPAEENDASTLVTREVTITNLGAPSVVSKFSVEVRPEGSSQWDTVEIIPVDQPVRMEFTDGRPPETLPADRYLPMEVREKPIPTNGAIVGFIPMFIHNVNRTTIMSPKTIFRMHCYDARGKEFISDSNIGQHLIGWRSLESLQPKSKGKP